MKKFILASIATAVLALSVPVNAQQATGGVANNKKQAIESLNAIRFKNVAETLEKMNKALEEKISKEAVARDENDKSMNKAVFGENNAGGLQGELQTLRSELTDLTILVKKIGACKPATVGKCNVTTKVPLDGYGYSGCKSGYTHTSSGYGFSYPCSVKCDASAGLTVVSTTCREYKSCKATTSVSVSGFGGIGGALYTTNISAAGHGSTSTAACSTAGACFGNGTYQTNYSSCTFKCNDGRWSPGTLTGENKVKTCPPMNFTPNYGFNIGL